MRGIMDFFECERPTRLSGMLLSYICKTSHHPLIAQSRRCLHKDVSIVLGMLERVEMKVKAPQVMYICPTDAFAVEVHKLVKKIGRHTYTGPHCNSPDPYSQHRQSLNPSFVKGHGIQFMFWSSKESALTPIENYSTRMISKTLVFGASNLLFPALKLRILIFYAAFCNSVQQVAPLLLSRAKHNLIFVNPGENGLTMVQQFIVLLLEPSDVADPFDVKIHRMAWTLIQGEEQKALIDRIKSRMDLQIRKVEQDRLHEVFQEAVL
ncbi:hypothetical protein Tco_0535858 [Tanacetum coccineum]